jgi:hypothetical protein
LGRCPTTAEISSATAGVIISTDYARPSGEFARCDNFRGGPRTPDENSLFSRVGTVKELLLGFHETFERAPLSVDIDNKSFEMRQKYHCTRIQTFELLLDGANGILRVPRSSAIKSKADDRDVSIGQKGLTSGADRSIGRGKIYGDR